MRVGIIAVFFLILNFDLVAQSRTYDTLPNQPEHYVAKLALFKKEPVEVGKIIMLGNSITEGGNWKTLLKDSSIINRGISGDVTFGILNRLEEVLKRKPAKIFLLIGINDLSRNTPHEVILENLFSIANRIKSGSPGTQLFIQSILPTNESFKNFPANFKNKSGSIIIINTQLKKYAERLNYQFIDLYSKFLDSSGNMEVKFATDGLHLTQLGYQHWASILQLETITGLK